MMDADWWIGYSRNCEIPSHRERAASGRNSMQQQKSWLYRCRYWNLLVGVYQRTAGVYWNIASWEFSVITLTVGESALPVESRTLRFSEWEEARIYQADNELTLEILDVWQGLLAEKILFTKLVLWTTSYADSFPCQICVVNSQKVGIT
jgi:hypothetical protein